MLPLLGSVFGDMPRRGAARGPEAAGLRVVAWTVNRVEDARRARDLGAAGLCTDAPAEVRRGLADGPPGLSLDRISGRPRCPSRPIVICTPIVRPV